MTPKELAINSKSIVEIISSSRCFECFSDINNNAMILVTKVHWALGVLLEATSFSARSQPGLRSDPCPLRMSPKHWPRLKDIRVHNGVGLKTAKERESNFQFFAVNRS